MLRALKDSERRELNRIWKWYLKKAKREGNKPKDINKYYRRYIRKLRRIGIIMRSDSKRGIIFRKRVKDQ